MIDSIADMLTRIRNASRALIPDLEVPHSKVKESVVRILKQQGYIEDFAVENKGSKKIKLKLKFASRKPVITKIQRLSTPGMRRYVNASEIPKVLGGMGTVIVSTSRGVMTGVEAKSNNVGGELICKVW